LFCVYRKLMGRVCIVYMINVKEGHTFLLRFSICCCKSSFCMDIYSHVRQLVTKMEPWKSDWPYYTKNCSCFNCFNSTVKCILRHAIYKSCIILLKSMSNKKKTSIIMCKNLRKENMTLINPHDIEHLSHLWLYRDTPQG